MTIIGNRYVRCAIGAVVAAYAAPKVNNLLNWTIPELTPTDGIINRIEIVSIVGVIAGITSVALAAAFSVPEASSSGGGTPAAPPAAGGS